MTQVQNNQTPPSASDSKLVRIAIWVAIGALIAAAIVCVVWVLVGTQNGLVGRAFLTILLLASFAGIAILDARLAPRRPAWFALTSMVVWVVTLLLGSFLIWMPERSFGYGYGYGIGRFLAFLLIVLVLQLAVLHVRLYMKAYLRHVTTFATIVTITTVALVGILAFMLVFALAFNEFFTFSDTYWRWVVAFAILAAVGTALVPLTNALFAPKGPRDAPAAPPVDAYGYAPVPQAWPTYVDGVTPLPVLADGTPDWNAYYTGYPTTTAQAIAPAPSVATPDPHAWVDPSTPPAPQSWDQHAAQQPWHDPAAHQQAWTDLGQQNGWGAEPAGWGEPQAAVSAEPQPSAWPEFGQTPPVPPAGPGYEGYPPPPPLPQR